LSTIASNEGIDLRRGLMPLWFFVHVAFKGDRLPTSMLSAFALTAFVPTFFVAAALWHDEVPDAFAEPSATPSNVASPASEDDDPSPTPSASSRAEPPAVSGNAIPNNAPLKSPVAQKKEPIAIPPDAPVFAIQLRDRLKKGDVRGAATDIIARVTAEPALLLHRDVRAVVVDVAGSVGISADATSEAYFAMLSGKADTYGIDVLYELVTTRGQSKAAARAESLLLTESVLARGSPALRTAWTLRRAKTCADKKALFPLVRESGDHRSMAELIPMSARCKRRGPACCLHGDRDLTELLRAMREKGL
jgi:eukaryotic-like serine/threonine-protein kinase